MRLTSRLLLFLTSLLGGLPLSAQRAPVTRAITPQLAFALPWMAYEGVLWTRLTPTSGRSPAPFVSSVRVRFREQLGVALTFDYPLSNLWTLSASTAVAHLESEFEIRGLSGDRSTTSTGGSVQRLDLSIGRAVRTASGVSLSALVGAQVLRARFDGRDTGFAHTMLSPGAVVGLRAAYPVTARGAIQLGATLGVYRTDEETLEEFFKGGSSVTYDIDPQTITRVGFTAGYRVRL